MEHFGTVAKEMLHVSSSNFLPKKHNLQSSEYWQNLKGITSNVLPLGNIMKSYSHSVLLCSNWFQFYFGIHQQIPLHFVTLDGGNIASVDKKYIELVVFILTKLFRLSSDPKQSLSRPISNTPE